MGRAIDIIEHKINEAMNFFILKYSPYFLFLSLFFEESKIAVTPVRM